MNYIANARLMLTKCRDCLGCNLLENENFLGDNNCRNFRNGVSKDEKSIRMWGVNCEYALDGRTIHGIPAKKQQDAGAGPYLKASQKVKIQRQQGSG